ncbi:DNA recombination protein RmuC [Nocardioides fonticola]|uniref:DNA recombination protein RmuC n=1 Tax=Nocardioides fonticola TaxID=450363 RepID=A0ABP7XH26_9ACTN
MDTTIAVITLLAGLALGALLGVPIGQLRQRARSAEHAIADAARQAAAGGDPAAREHAELVQSLDRISDQLLHLDRERAGFRGALEAQVAQMQQATAALGTETRALATALRKPQVRGRWGELHLRRAVELAGLVDRCDFHEQVQLDDGARRPDLVVQLVGERRIVVDAKVPLDAYLEATSTDDPAEQQHHLQRHARQLRTHVDGLSGKAYWRSLEHTPEFVVLFVPAESFLAAALETDPMLLEYAAARQVVLATPTTLIALLRTVAQGWAHERLADQAREIHRLGRDLHDRLGTFGSHLDQVGRSLNAAVGHYNSAVGSYDHRVLVGARRFRDLAVTDDELPTPRQVTLRAVEGSGAPAEADDVAGAGAAADPTLRRGSPEPPPRRSSVVS